MAGANKKISERNDHIQHFYRDTYLAGKDGVPIIILVKV